MDPAQENPTREKGKSLLQEGKKEGERVSWVREQCDGEGCIGFPKEYMPKDAINTGTFLNRALKFSENCT